MGTVVLIGTVKGGFLLRSNDRRQWEIEPVFRGWKVSSAVKARDGKYLVGTASWHYGASISVSTDLAEWTQLEHNPRWAEGGERKLNEIWKLHADSERILAGVDEAGLFQSTDAGASWTGFDGLNEHPLREKWVPGFGGLCCHSILTDPKDPQRIWVGISAVGCWRTDDGGATWAPKNEGVAAVCPDETTTDIGYCVHQLVADPDDANRIFRQDHAGMYRSVDGGDTWQHVAEGLPSDFGFPIAYDKTNGTVYAIPLESDQYRFPTEGRLAVYRSTDDADTWNAAAEGLPAANFHAGVLRCALDVDGRADGGGVYFGTTSGDVFTSPNGGESWDHLPARFPRVLCVKVLEAG